MLGSAELRQRMELLYVLTFDYSQIMQRFSFENRRKILLHRDNHCRVKHIETLHL